MMKQVDPEKLKSFINAAQLCLTVPIASFMANEKNIWLKFNTHPRGDKGFDSFQKLTDGKWDEKELRLIINNFDGLFGTPIINFLMLSRLKEKNMIALAKIDAQYRPLVKKILGTRQIGLERSIDNPKQAAEILFSHVQKQKMTLRELSEKSGLTQMAISNFKTGKDIRLSSLIQISKALGIRVILDES